MPLVSICVPTFNGAAYLSQCINSAIGQSFRDIEIVIVDDGSSDETLVIARQYQRRDPRLRIYANPRNYGLVANWNQCVMHARGEWVKFLFQDDVLRRECVERMLSLADPDRAPFLLCHRDFLFNADSSSELREAFASHAQQFDRFALHSSVSAEEFANAILTHGICNNFLGEPTASLIHKTLFRRWGLFNRNVINACDSEYWYRLGSNVGVTFVPEVLAKFRVHGQSASATNHTNRLFRLTILDPLVVLHDFLYSKHYRALRQVIGCRQGPKYLKWLCYEKTVEAYTLLASKRLAAEPDATKSLTEWEAVCRAYPRLRLFIWQKHIIDYWKSHRVAFPPAVVRKIVRWFGVLS